jgi:hypothetical protein
MKFSCSGLHPKDDCSRLNSSIALWLLQKVAASPGRVFGKLRPLRGQPFLRGRRL